MAEIAVFHVLANFAPFLQEEVNLLTGVRDEIEYIRGEFERMTAFLRIADAMDETDPGLEVWVKQVREAAYDAADALDMHMLRLGHHHGNGVRGFLRKVSCYIKTIKARHQIASEVKRIKSRLINISEGRQRYGDIYRRQEQGSRPTVAWYDFRGDALLLEEAELVGIEKPKRELTQLLLEEDPRLKVVSIAGMGGLGKTTLTKKVYDDTIVKKHFQNHAWITVSESFKIEKLLQSMIEQLFEEVKQLIPQGVENMDTNSLKGIINAFLKQKRYVLVLDDVWDIHAWQSFRYAFPNGNCSSRVILTTRNIDLASFSSGEYHGKVYNLIPLSPEDSWTLFCRKTFLGFSCPSYLEGLSRDILRRCEGLPLAIVVISSLLSTKEKSVEEWERISRSFGAELEGNEKLTSMSKILSLSFFDLPWNLKLCFLYLSIFPEDYLIFHWRLIRSWVAEGFVEQKDGMTAEEVAQSYLNGLINRSLIQVAERRHDRRIRAYRIHDLWREIIVSKSREQNIVTVASECGIVWPKKVRRLSVHQNWESEQERSCFTHLRSLIVFSSIDSFSIFSKVALLGDDLRLLTLLDLEGTQLETFPIEVVKLCHLRHLSLRKTNVKTIPKSIGNLQNLETLDLKGTHVTEMPDEILKLQRLRHLLLYRYYAKLGWTTFRYQTGFKAPMGIGSLSSLQKLCSIEANHDNNNGMLLRDVGKLTQLIRVHILKLRRGDGKMLCSSLEKLKNLRSLLVSAIQEDEIIDLDSLSSPPQCLRTLYLAGHLQCLPRWIPSSFNLVRVCLWYSKLRDVDPLRSLQDLPNLASLEILHAYVGEELCFKAGAFQNLETLVLSELKELIWPPNDFAEKPSEEIGEIGKKNNKKKKHKEEREDDDKSLNSGQICDGNRKNDVIVQESGTLHGSNEIGKKKKNKNKHKEGREDKNLNDGLVFYDAQRRKILDRSSEECDEERESCSGVVVSEKDIKEIKYSALKSFAESGLPKSVGELQKFRQAVAHSVPFLAFLVEPAQFYWDCSNGVR
ncbi:Disease resistance protein [Actinidia chinensis var. chinensis]|uniref:Disease resistance protein n=1 Tax=Actinidia chinensis var. chinensis TaxID=1590841 RepID=A0A2R6PIJ5_ACTCC|nr:Disease resistance protein [Actinidia chinensis var. chinensis]